MKKRSLSILAVIIVLGFCFGSTIALADCLPSTRDVKFSDGSTQIRTYVCRLSDALAPAIEVEFDRLSEVAAGNLVENTPYSDLSQILGSPQVLQNDVFSEVKNLFDKYGTRELVQSCYLLAVSSAVPNSTGYTNGFVKSHGDTQHCNEKRVMWYLWIPDQENITSIGMPLLKDQTIYLNTTRWPDGWNFFYGPGGGDACRPPWIHCTIIWRPAKKSDLTEYWDDKKKEEKELGLQAGGAQPDTTEPFDALMETPQKLKRFFSLIEHLNGDGWQDGFLTLVGSSAGCGPLAFELKTRQLLLETAFVKNVSNEALSLDGLIGSAEPERGLRPITGKVPVEATNVVSSDQTRLEPGASIVIPLRILFVPAGGANSVFQDGLSDTPIDRAGALRIYRAIMATRPGTVFEDRDDSGKPVRKVRESFGAPSVPSLPDYAFGPAFDLSGLMVAGQHLDFNASARNFFKIAAGEGYGSCPYLYSYDDGTGEWAWHGKIIDTAHAANLEVTQRVDFPGLVTRFSIREEELEVSYIRRIALELSLGDGRLIKLNPISIENPHDYTVIKSGEGREFAFVVPAGIERNDVKRSTLAVTGYYDPYASLAVIHSR